MRLFSVLRILDAHPGSCFFLSTSDPGYSKKRDLLSRLFCCHKLHKIVNYYIFEQAQTKFAPGRVSSTVCAA
jgi:hypothetical protein